MSERMSLETVIKIIIIVLVIGVIFIFVFPNIWKEAKAFLGFGGDTNNINKDLNNTRSDLFVSIINTMKTCFDNQDSNCYCILTNTYIPTNTLAEFANSNNGLHAYFYRDVIFSSCEIKKEGTLVQQELMSGKSFYFEDSYGIPSADTNGMIANSQYTIGQRAYISGSNLCSTKDVTGSNSIDFTQGVLYKIDMNSILLTRKQEVLRPCSAKNNVPVVASN